MRRILIGTAAGLFGMLLAFGAARAAAPPQDRGDNTCGSFGTTVTFVDTPTEAAKLAREQEKLVFVLHVSGTFEKPEFT